MPKTATYSADPDEVAAFNLLNSIDWTDHPGVCEREGLRPEAVRIGKEGATQLLGMKWHNTHFRHFSLGGYSVSEGRYAKWLRVLARIEPTVYAKLKAEGSKTTKKLIRDIERGAAQAASRPHIPAGSVGIAA